MSQIGNALKMYFLLKSKGKMKSRDIAGLLETDERTVRRYRADLEQAGIFIGSETGKYGGYKLMDDNLLLGLNLTDSEYFSLQLIEKYLKDTKHIAAADISSIAEKINVLNRLRNIEAQEISSHMAKAILSNASREAEKRKLVDIHAAVLSRNKLRLNYTSLSSGAAERTVCPYATFQYKGDMYFAGFCETKKGMLDFKMSRINDYEVLDEVFERDGDFDLKDFMDNCIGIYKGAEYRIKLRIEHPMSQIVREKVWVENQVITGCGGGAIIYEADMRGLAEIKSWILGMGSMVKVIAPKEIAGEIENEVDKMKNLYCANGCP